jgi:hypothetical protein
MAYSRQLLRECLGLAAFALRDNLLGKCWLLCLVMKAHLHLSFGNSYWSSKGKFICLIFLVLKVIDFLDGLEQFPDFL